MGKEETGYSAGSILLSFFIGGLVGAGVALLVAPKSGQETREKLRELAEDAKEKADSYLEKVKGTATTVMEKGKEILDQQKSILTTAVEAGKEAYDKEKERVAQEHQS